MTKTLTLCILATASVVIALQPAPAPADVGMLRAWTALSAAQSVSPASGQAGDHVVDWVGPDGRPVHLVVRVPIAARQQHVVSVSPTDGDAGPVIAAAVAQVAQGGVVRLQPGTYRIGGSANWRDPALSFSGLGDVTILGPGATLLFTRPGNGIRIADSNRVLIDGVTLRYADPAMVLGRIAPDGALVPAGKGFTAESLTIYQATVFNTQTRAYPRGGARVLLGKTGSFLPRSGPGRLAAASLAQVSPGNTVAMKLGYYQGSVVDVRDTGAGPGSSDIILDRVAIENGRGMGVTVSQMNRGFALLNSRLGPASLADLPDGIAFDGVHVTAAAGDILIQHNTIVGTGDDGINLASPILDVTGSGSPTDVSVKPAGSIRSGDQLALFDSQLNFLGNAQVTGRERTDASGASDVHLARPLGLDRARYARNLRFTGSRYAVIDNAIGHCVCHGVLVQGPNGLVSGNHFDALRYNAIRLVTSGAWGEGAGVANVIVAGNQINDTGEESRRGFPWAAITVYGELAGSVPAPGVLASDIAITHNTIANYADGCISVLAAVHVSVSANRCDANSGGPPVRVDPASTQDVHVAR